MRQGEVPRVYFTDYKKKAFLKEVFQSWRTLPEAVHAGTRRHKVSYAGRGKDPLQQLQGNLLPDPLRMCSLQQPYGVDRGPDCDKVFSQRTIL